MKTGEVIRKKIDNDDGTITLVFYTDEKKVAKAIVDKNYDVIKLEGEIPDGMVNQYYDNGNILAEAYYKDSKREGLTKIYTKTVCCGLNCICTMTRPKG